MNRLEKISTHLKNKGISKSWLASKLGISRSYLTNMLAGRFPLDKKKVEKINQILETKF